MKDETLTVDTREHYEGLISNIGDKYLHNRWFSNPASIRHYDQTKKSIYNLLSKKPEGVESLLEIGSGPGTWTDIFINYASHVTLFDISNEFLKLVKNKYSENSRSIDFVCGDFVNDDGRLTQTYDFIVTVRALEYMSDKGAVVNHCYAHLNTGGKLAIITKNPMWRDKRRDISTDTIHRGQIYWLDLKKLFIDAGFKSIQIYPVVLGSYHPPYNNAAGRVVCDIMHHFVYKNFMKASLDSMTESYLIYGEKY